MYTYYQHPVYLSDANMNNRVKCLNTMDIDGLWEATQTDTAIADAC